VDEVLGRFNDHLKDAVLLVMDECEGFGGDAKSGNLLKSLVTSTTLNVDTKHVRQYTVDKSWHMVMLGNRSGGGWLVRVERGDRRYVVCETEAREDPAYNAAVFDGPDPLFTEANAEIFFRYLAARPLAGVDLRRVPESAARRELLAMNPDFQPIQFLVDLFSGECTLPESCRCLCGEAGCKSNLQDHLVIRTLDLFRLFVRWAGDRKTRMPAGCSAFGRQLAGVKLRAEKLSRGPRKGCMALRLTPAEVDRARRAYMATNY
jgi:hypothetical protein